MDSFGVIVVSNPVQPLESCGSGSILELQERTAAEYGASNVRCIVDPPVVLSFVCDETKLGFTNVTLVNKELKCNYWNAIKDMGLLPLKGVTNN